VICVKHIKTLTFVIRSRVVEQCLLKKKGIDLFSASTQNLILSYKPAKTGTQNKLDLNHLSNGSFPSTQKVVN
jgi:hypothetical protein